MKKFNPFNYILIIIEWYADFKSQCDLLKLSPVGHIIHEYLNDSVFIWATNEYDLWIEDRDFKLDIHKYTSGKFADEKTSPCVLWIKSGKEYLNDKRTLELTDHDRNVLWPLVEQKIDEIEQGKLYKYKELRNIMIINKLKGIR